MTNRVTIPTYETSRMRPASTRRPFVASASSRIRTFSGRIVKRFAVALDDVRHADEAGDELVRRVLVDLRGRAHLLDAPVREHRQTVAHRERLLLVVRDVDECDAHLALDRAQLVLHLLAELQVERPERLVEQEHLRAVHEGARERHALPLPAGELRRPPLSYPPRRTSSSASDARLRRSSRATFAMRRPYSTFSPTVMWGKSA